MQILKTGHSTQQDSLPVSPIRKISPPLMKIVRVKVEKRAKISFQILFPLGSEMPINGLTLKIRVGKNDSLQHGYSNVVLFPALSLG